MSHPPEQARSSHLLLALAIILVAMNLRPALTSLGPVLESVREGLLLSPTAVGALITLPVLCFGAFAPFAPQLLRYVAMERLVFLGLLVLAGGIALRSMLGVSGMFAGTFLAGASISVVMVLLPTIIKRDFPRQAGHMMGVYSMALCLGASLAAGATVPLEELQGSNWQWALAFWAVPAVIAAAVWRWHIMPGPEREEAGRRQNLPRLRGDRLAWQVTLYMGLQSALAYCVFGWLPTILIDRGMTPLVAGLALSVSVAMQLVTALSGPWIATRGKDQRRAIFVMMVLTLTGLMGSIYGSIDAIWPWVIVLGLGQGGTFSIALALLVLRAPNPQFAASLSGMAQGVGYSLAALGPLMVGVLHEWSGDWDTVAVFFVLVAAAGLAAGLGAGRVRYVGGTRTAETAA